MTEVVYEKTAAVDMDAKEMLLNGEFDMNQYKKSKKHHSSKSPSKHHMKTPCKKSSRTDTIFEVKLQETKEFAMESAMPTQVQLDRWDKVASKKLPEIDYVDMVKETVDECAKRQFAPIYSQKSYETLLSKELVLAPAKDPYWKLSSRVTEDERSHLIVVVEELIRLKEYKEETFYIACSIADRYILSLAKSNHQPECLMNLAVTVVLISAKLEQ